MTKTKSAPKKDQNLNPPDMESPATECKEIYLESPPSLAEFQRTLYCAYRSHDDYGYLCVTSSMDGSTWYTPPSKCKDIEMGSAPSLAAFGDKLYCAFKKKTDDCFLCVTFSPNGSDWYAPAIECKGIKIQGTPSLAVFNNKLYCAFKSNDLRNALYITYSEDGKHWMEPATELSGIQMGFETSPSLAVFNNRLYCAIRSNDPRNELYVSSSSDGSTWTTPAIEVVGVFMGSSPSLAASNQGLYCAFLANDPRNILYITTSEDGKHWLTPQDYPDIKSGSRFALAYWSGQSREKLTCAFKSYDWRNVMYATSSK